MCINDCELFPKLQPAQYQQHRDDCCSKCGERRFDIAPSAAGERCVPRKRFWHLGLQRAGQLWMADPAWCALRGTGRAAAEDVYTSKLAEDIDEATGGAALKEENSFYELFFDFAQPFSFKQYSMGIIAARCGLWSHGCGELWFMLHVAGACGAYVGGASCRWCYMCQEAIGSACS